jgi:carboxypeptidase Q
MPHRPLRLAWVGISAALVLLALPSAALPAPKRGSEPLAEVLARLIGEEAVSQGAYKKLAHLTDRIGPRLSGSPGAEAAVAWSAEELRNDGLARVRTERVMVPHWVRGEETAVLLSPSLRPLLVTALGMSIPTPAEGVTGEVVEVGSFEELQSRGDAVRGKIVLYYKPMERHPDGESYGSAATLRYRGAAEAAKQGAVAMLIRSLGTLSARLPHTGVQGYQEGVEKIPAAAVAAEDADLIHRLLASGEHVRVRLTLGCRLLPDAESANVVAELRGSSRPEEVLVIGGHLDSWDLGTGAIDDGAGVAITMETMRLLKKLGLRPRRTIRAVLFMNEENGNRGGKGYADAHQEELERHVAAIESDSGAGKPLGFSVTAGAGGLERVADLSRFLESLSATRVLPDGGGVDIGPMRRAGVPLLSLRQDMTHYFDWHHTAADTLDKVDPRELADNAVAMAFMAYALAEDESPLPRIPEDQRQEKE